ncbi:hypothetical protein [Pelagovum pacificum]|uniref:Uncharacterized protein n=1 Tax=Pelagovum pacificum TaxID=2588711 RepID=A0A5C5G986_9RHOB|nr:hypothetical protein [Pelagovum pacificum]QQA42210.1 hypothetical protein I8N54_15640 [Pelagovum pacificum]TNY31296.1 hypothetical protein FHY64_14825 [Pelagovum pacificum]
MLRFSLTAALVAATTPGIAGQYDSSMEAYLLTELRPWFQSEEIVGAVLAQNRTTGTYDSEEILEMDERWRAEVNSNAQPTIRSVVNNSTSDFLRERMNDSGGTITEIILMDASGLNVAASHVTSDYWQGDEDKHAMTYGVGPLAVHFGEIEFDESSQIFQGQVSATIVDPEDGSPIGAITIGLNAEALM